MKHCARCLRLVFIFILWLGVACLPLMAAFYPVMLIITPSPQVIDDSSIHPPSREYFTVYLFTSRRPSLELVNELIRHGANVNIQDAEGLTSFHNALSDYNSNAVLHALLNAGLNIYHVDINNNSLLHWTAAFNNYDLTNTLLEKGVNVMARNNQGETPLHTITVNAQSEDARHLPFIRLLLYYDADPLAPDNSGHTPLDNASRAAHHKRITLLCSFIREKFQKHLKQLFPLNSLRSDFAQYSPRSLTLSYLGYKENGEIVLNSLPLPIEYKEQEYEALTRAE